MTNKMMEVEKLTEDKAMMRLNYFIYLDDYNDTCVTCGLPYLLHRGDTCIRSNCVEMGKECLVWKMYREKIKPIVVWMKRAVVAEKEQTGCTKSLETMMSKMSEKDSG